MQTSKRSTSSRKRFSPTRLSIGKFLNSEMNCSNNRLAELNSSNRVDHIRSGTTVRSTGTDGTEYQQRPLLVGSKKSIHASRSVKQIASHYSNRSDQVETKAPKLSDLTIQKAGAMKKYRGLKMTPKCVKHSPRLAPRPQPRLEVFEFEQEQWQKAYKTMGELYTVIINKVPYGDVIREVPFHCAPVHHEFKAQYGLQNQFGATTTHDVPQKKDKEYTFTVRTQMPFFRPMRRHDTVYREISNVQRKHNIIYIPITAVKVIFTPGMLSYQGAWKMMMPYGPIECCLIEGTNYILVVYKTLLDADEAVRSEAFPHGVSISWLDKRLYNRGHFMELEHYSVDQDPRWTEGLERRWCTQGMHAESMSNLLAKQKRQTDSTKVPVLTGPAMSRRSSPAMPRRNSPAAARSSIPKRRDS